jgi:hypothetical protein
MILGSPSWKFVTRWILILSVGSRILDCTILPSNQPSKELTKGGDLCEAQVDVPLSEQPFLRFNSSLGCKTDTLVYNGDTLTLRSWWRGRFSCLGDSQAHPVAGRLSSWPVRYEATRSGVNLESLPSNGLYRSIRLAVLATEPLEVAELARRP